MKPKSRWHWDDRDKLAAQTSASRCGRITLPCSAAFWPRAVNRLAPETPYWPSSPSADYEEVSDKYQSGDMHDWSVWHGRVPFSEYEKHFPRFMTEYGFQSFPEMRTVETFTMPEDRPNIFTPVMLAHQKNNAGNSIIHDYMLRDYPAAERFRLVPLRQPGIAGRRHQGRRRTPAPQPSAHHGLHLLAAQRLLAGRFVVEPRLLRTLEGAAVLRAPLLRAAAGFSALRKTATSPSMSSPTRPRPPWRHLRVRILNFDGAVLSDKSQPVTITPLSSKVYLTVPMLDITNLPNADLGKIFAVTDLAVDNKVISSERAVLRFQQGHAVPASEDRPARSPREVPQTPTPSTSPHRCSPAASTSASATSTRNPLTTISTCSPATRLISPSPAPPPSLT